MKDQATHLLSSENYIIFKWTAIHNKLIKSNCFTIALLLLFTNSPSSTPWKPWKTQNRCRTKRILHTTAQWELTIGYYLEFGVYNLIRNFFYTSIALKLQIKKLSKWFHDSFFNTLEFYFRFFNFDCCNSPWTSLLNALKIFQSFVKRFKVQETYIMDRMSNLKFQLKTKFL